MHIKFEDEGLLVDNLQLFLKRNLQSNIALSGVWDEASHKALIQYLKKPNTANVYEMKDLIRANFTFRSALPPYLLVGGGGIANFDNEVTPDSITYFTKPTISSYENGVLFISDHLNELAEFVRKYGWEIVAHTGYGTGTEIKGATRAEISLKKTGIHNYFPQREVLPMVNLFTGKYIYGIQFAQTENDAYTVATRSSNYKVAAIPCEPGDVFTIAHGYSIACEMAFGYIEGTLRELKSGGIVNGIRSRMDGSIKGPVNSGSYDLYEIPLDSKATYMLVQMPYSDQLTAYANVTTTIQIGDVNLDGVVNEADVSLLEQWVVAKENNTVPATEITGNALIAANVTQDVDIEGYPIVDRRDLMALQSAIESGKTDSLPTKEFTSSVRVSAHESEMLLVMYGADCLDESLNIPIAKYAESPWAIHSKFLEYFLQRVIHKYSDIEDISWLQENIHHYNPNYEPAGVGVYDDGETYKTDAYIEYEQISGRYKYYKNNAFTGYYVISTDALNNGVFTDDQGKQTNQIIQNRRIYSGTQFTGQVVLNNGVIANEGAEYSLKNVVKEFQNRINAHPTVSGQDDKIYWTYGNFCVDTEINLSKALHSQFTYTNNAFR